MKKFIITTIILFICLKTNVYAQNIQNFYGNYDDWNIITSVKNYLKSIDYIEKCKVLKTGNIIIIAVKSENENYYNNLQTSKFIKYSIMNDYGIYHDVYVSNKYSILEYIGSDDIKSKVYKINYILKFSIPMV